MSGSRDNKKIRRIDGSRYAKSPVSRRKKKKNFRQDLMAIFFGLLIALLESAQNVFIKIKDMFIGLDKRTKVIAVSSAGMTLALVLLIIILVALSKPNGIEIYLNDTVIGRIKLEKNIDIDEAYINDLVIGKLEAAMTEKVQCYDNISIQKVKAKEFVTLDNAVSEIVKKINYRVQAAIITVNGTRIAIVKNTDEADKILNEIAGRYYDASLGITSTSFVEVVDVVLEYVEPSQRMSNNQTKERLTAQEMVEDFHTAVSGDNLTNICTRYGMTMNDMTVLNPTINPRDTLRIGTILKIVRPQPVISVKTIAEETSVWVIKYKKETVSDPNQPRNYQAIIQQGKDGQEEVTEIITRINGLEISREVKNRVTLVAAQDEKKVVGSK